MKDTIKSLFLTAVIISSLYFCIAYPGQISEAISLSIVRCTDIIIPSMFLFMYITSITVSSGLHTFIGRLSGPIPLKLFHLRNDYFGIFLMSLFSGYPAGIKLLCDLYNQEKIDKTDFERLSCFCFAGGPAFIQGTVSGILFPETSAGLLCFISVTLGNIITAFISGLFSDKRTSKSFTAKVQFSTETITQSAISSAKAIFQMSIMIIAFGGIWEIAVLSGLTEKIALLTSHLTGIDINTSAVLISSFFEISSIINLPQNAYHLLPVISALLSFGGVCVLAQIIVISNGLLNIRRFIKARLFSAVMSAIVCRAISRFFYLGTANAFSEIKVHSNTRILPTVFLIIMVYMLLSLAKSYRQSD